MSLLHINSLKIHARGAHSLESLMEGNNSFFFKLVCRDSSEISHCLLLISLGNSRFKRVRVQKEVISELKRENQRYSNSFNSSCAVVHIRSYLIESRSTNDFVPSLMSEAHFIIT
jgi:hypothetical protein